MVNTPLMATSYPVLVFGAAFLMLGLAKLGIVKINNAATMCFVAGILGSVFALFLYTAGLPHLVGLLATPAGTTAALGDTLGPLLLALASALTLFSMLFIMVGFQGTGILAHEITSTGLFAALIGLFTLPFGIVIFGMIQLLGVILILYSSACIVLGLALRFNTGVKLAAVVVVLGSAANMGIALAFQFGMLP
jgi:hypothetical protein